ncbi:MAG: BatD family protein [Deltaproteobacteria bacterium]
MKYSLVAAAALGALALPTFAFAGARAQLAGSLAAGQPAQLDVTVDGEVSGAPDVHVPGARVQLNGQMSSTQIVNGASSQQTKFIYSVVPDAAGELDIPAISVATSTGAQTTAPIHATVSSSPRPSPSPFSGSVGASPAPATTNAAAPTGRVIQSSPHAFITLDVPTHKLVVGQAVPVTIRAYFRAGTSATLDGAPHLTTDAFTLSNLSDKPAQTQVQLRGEPYLQATWTALLSPAKPSTGKLAVELPVELAYRAAPRPAQHRTMRDIFGADPFGDAFGSDSPFGDSDPFGAMDMDIDSMFDIGPMQQEQVTLRGPTSTVTVIEPPDAGKPADYSGAVGAFSLSVDPPTGTPRVGEPLTLAFHVTGTGNFDRVTGIALADATGMKTYPAKADFVAGTTPLTGTKTFTQTIVPTRAGTVEVPAATFSYFDPAKHAYVTAHTAPLSLTVVASPGGGAADPGLAASVREPGMLPNRVDPGEPHAELMPLVDRASTWLGVAGILAATILAILIAWSRRSHRIASVLASRRVDREVARATEAMQRAADQADPVAFFSAARTALQTRLASTWHTRADAITAHDVAARLGDRGETIREVFEHADGMAYGAPTTEPLEYWDGIVRAELAHLEVSP